MMEVVTAMNRMLPKRQDAKYAELMKAKFFAQKNIRREYVQIATMTWEELPMMTHSYLYLLTMVINSHA